MRHACLGAHQVDNETDYGDLIPPARMDVEQAEGEEARQHIVAAEDAKQKLW
tara:strand:- start:120 stop:275 length:156 start_codon:yes stop_codon:yes gene_type:complete